MPMKYRMFDVKSIEIRLSLSSASKPKETKNSNRPCDRISVDKKKMQVMSTFASSVSDLLP